MKNYLHDENIILHVSHLCVEKLLVTVMCFFSVALDRRFSGPVIITSIQGGSNIEEIAMDHPEAIIHHPIDIITGLQRHDALSIGEKLGFRNKTLEEVCEFHYFINLPIRSYL